MLRKVESHPVHAEELAPLPIFYRALMFFLMVKGLCVIAGRNNLMKEGFKMVEDGPVTEGKRGSYPEFQAAGKSGEGHF